MEKKTKNRGNNKSQSSFENELGPLVKAIDDAVAVIPDARKRKEVREAVGQAVHGAIHQLASRPASSGRALAPTLIGDATGVAVDAVSRVQDLGFVEFTTGLINGTFDAIIGATVKQMQAYAELVASLAKTLDEFQAENVTTAEISTHLAAQYPDGSGGTTVRSTYVFKDTPAVPDKGIPARTAAQNLQLVADALVTAASGVVDANGEPLLKFDLNTDSSAPNATTRSFSSAWVNKARGVVGKLLAKTMIEHLRAMAREGMARIVITNGELLSKLTFRVESSEVEKKRESDYRSERISANLGLRYGGRLFKASLSASYDNMKVNTVDAESFDSVTMSAEIIGQVKINFRTESFAPVVKDGPIL